MEEDKSGKERSSIRFFASLKGRYFIEGGERGLEDCTLMNISPRGMSIRFHTHEKINPGSTILIEISIPGEFGSMSVRGILKWSGKEGDHFIGGIELTEVLDEDKLAKLAKLD